MVAPLVHYGEVPFDLAPLLKEIKAISSGAWIYRTDKESDTTCVVREGRPCFPKALCEALITAAMGEFLSPGYQNRLVLSCVPAGGYILPHRDDFGVDVQARSIHCHIPLISSPEAVMEFPEHGIVENMKVGHLYSMDAREEHSVRNPSAVDRVHLLFAHYPH